MKIKTELKDSALKLLITAFIREPMESLQNTKQEESDTSDDHKSEEIFEMAQESESVPKEEKEDANKEYTVVQSLCKHYIKRLNQELLIPLQIPIIGTWKPLKHCRQCIQIASKN